MQECAGKNGRGGTNKNARPTTRYGQQTKEEKKCSKSGVVRAECKGGWSVEDQSRGTPCMRSAIRSWAGCEPVPEFACMCCGMRWEMGWGCGCCCRCGCCRIAAWGTCIGSAFCWANPTPGALAAAAPLFNPRSCAWVGVRTSNLLACKRDGPWPGSMVF